MPRRKMITQKEKEPCKKWPNELNHVRKGVMSRFPYPTTQEGESIHAKTRGVTYSMTCHFFQGIGCQKEQKTGIPMSFS